MGTAQTQPSCWGCWEKNPAYAVLDDRGGMTLKYLEP